MLKATDPAYLQYQYADSAKLRIRAETRRQYSEAPDRLAAELLRYLDLRPGLIVLDVGCGPGRYRSTIAEADAAVVGVDASFGMVREARFRGTVQQSRSSVIQADAQARPFSNASFDRVLAVHMLYHVPDRGRALCELRRVLRPGGRVVLATNRSNYLSRLDTLHREAALTPGYQPTDDDGSRFTLDNLGLVRAVFPTAEREGGFRDPKDTGFFVADVA